MRPSIMIKEWAGIAMLAVGLCAVSITGCKKSPERIAEMTNLLFDAISKNDTEQAKLAISGGANLKVTRFDDGVTPLIYAIQKNRDAIVELLIKSKVDLNATDIGNVEWTPIYWAVYTREGLGNSHKTHERNINIVKMLIDAGADLNVRDSNGSTALQRATRRGYKDIVELLKAAGASE